MQGADPVAATHARRGPTGLAQLDLPDVYAGFPHGLLRPRTTGARGCGNPIAALRAALLPALRRPPCVVAFSGGRDSSLLLAVAAELAVQEGLPAPVAYTLRFPGDPAAEESSWQELVVAHLREGGLDVEWLCRAVHDELDLIGPLATPVLRGHRGPVFPAAVAPTVLLTSVAAGGALVTGNHGDEVLGDHRATLLRTVWRRRGRRMTRSDWFATAIAAAPHRARAWLLRVRDPGPDWLRPVFRTLVRDRQAADAAARPLRWDRSVLVALQRRAVQLGAVTRQRIAAGHDCTLVEPFGEPGFIAALAAHGGPWGRLARSDATRLLAGGLLPTAVVRRTTKAYFNRSRFGPLTRDFAAGWDGRGLDDDLVDSVMLRRAWLADQPPAASALLLQQAWLADQGVL